MISDQELVEKCIQEGNEHFEELIKRHSNYIYGFMMRLTGGNQMFAEDLTQTAVSYTHLTLPTICSV